MAKKIKVPVPPREWPYISSLKELADFLRRGYDRQERNPYSISKYEITKALRPLEDFAVRRYDKVATIARIMEILERDVGFESDDEREKISGAVVRLVEQVSIRRSREPDTIHDFIKNLRYALIGIFRGDLDPYLHEPARSSG